MLTERELLIECAIQVIELLPATINAEGAPVSSSIRQSWFFSVLGLNFLTEPTQSTHQIPKKHAEYQQMLALKSGHHKRHWHTGTSSPSAEIDASAGSGERSDREAVPEKPPQSLPCYMPHQGGASLLHNRLCLHSDSLILRPTLCPFHWVIAKNGCMVSIVQHGMCLAF